MTGDSVVPGYLGRVLDADGVAVGTCFQVSPGVLVTAWHVLHGLRCGEVGATVSVDALKVGGEAASAEVVQVDRLHDLAVMRASVPLAESVKGWSRTDLVENKTKVVATGVSKIDDPDYYYRWLPALGEWAGRAPQGQVLVGRMVSSSVMLGMSGAPVRRLTDDVVVGVVRARYNSADGWGEHSVWVARTEDLQVLLVGIVELQLDALPAVLVDLLDKVVRHCSDLGELFPERQHLSLLKVYVRQSVSSLAEMRRDDPLEESSEKQGYVERTRLASTLAQPFDDVFDQNDHLVIEGDAGMGKTMLARQLTVTRAEWARAPRADPAAPTLIPLLLPARVLAKHLDNPRRPHMPLWAEALHASVSEEYAGFSDHQMPDSQLTQDIKGYRWLVVIDALDEIPDEASRKNLLTQIADRIGQPTNSTRFLITTRPLNARETERLHGAGIFELQPFDSEALKRFALNWFNSDSTSEGEIAANHFLDQVRTAGLTRVLKMPLLAAITAKLHQSAPDSSLPANQYALYDRYIESYAEIRRSIAHVVLAELAGPDDERAERIDEERRPLLEHLALSYMKTETPLLDLAGDYLTKKDLLPARRGPKWKDHLAEWLCQGGLLSRSGQRLRFLHQTFAEHLAASAEAKMLPARFSITESAWAKLIRGMSQGNEHDTTVVLHYLHIGPDGDAVLDALQNGTLQQRERAGELISRGVPCDDARLENYLSVLRNEAFTDEPDFESMEKKLGGLIGRPKVPSWLVSLLEEDIHDELKIAVVDLVRDGIPLLEAYTGESWPPDHRRKAAKVLAKFGSGAHGFAMRVLLRMTERSATTVRDRVESAGLLVELGDAEHRQEAARVLADVAVDLGASPDERHIAVRELAKLGGEYLQQAVVLLQDMMLSPALGVSDRVEAASALAKVSRHHRELAADVLVKLVDDPAIDDGERLEVVQAILAIAPSRYDWAAKQLQRLLAEPALSGGTRVSGAKALGTLGTPHLPSAAELLAGVAHDYSIGPFWRLYAAQAIAGLGRTYRSRAVDIMSVLVQDTTMSFGERLDVINALVELGAEAYEVALRALPGLLDDPTGKPADWARAGQILANMGNEHRADVLQLCDAHLDDSTMSADWQVHTAILTGNVDPAREALARVLLVRLGRSMAVTSAAKEAIATELARTGAHADATALLARLGADVAASHGARRRAAVKLLSSPSHYRERGESALRHLTTDPTADTDDRWRAVDDLRDHRPDLQSELAEEHRWLLDLPRSPVDPYVADLFTHTEGDLAPVAEALQWRLADPGRITDLSGLIRLVAQVGGEHEHRRAIRTLRAVSSDATFPIEHRLIVAEALMEVNDEERAVTLTTLRAMVDNSEAPQRERINACLVLARARDETVGPWLDHLREAADARSRVQIAKVAVLCGGDRRRAAFMELDNIAHDPAVHPEHRLDALEHLVEKNGTERYNAIAAALRGLAADTLVWPESRLRACVQLGTFGGDQVREAADLARALALDPSTQPSWRMKVADVLDGWRGASLRGLVDTLRAVADARHTDPALRYQAAQHLVRLGPEPREHAVTALQDIADDRRADGRSRLQAAKHLRSLDQAARKSGLTALARLATEETAEPIPSIHARIELVRADETRAWETYSELTELGSNPTVPGLVRLEAVEGMLQIAPHNRRTNARMLHELTGDSLRGWERRLAALRLASLDLTCRPDAINALTRLVEDDSCAVWERTEAAINVAELDTPRREAMFDFVQRFAEDNRVTPACRRHAATTLLDMSRFRRDAANAVLRDLAVDEQAHADERRLAAVALATSGRERAEGIALLHAMTSEQFPDLARVQAWQSLIEVHSRYSDAGLSVMETIAKDEAADAAARYHASRALFDQPAEHRDLAVGVLGRLVSDTSVDEHHRALADGLLATRWFSDRNRAGAVLEAQAIGAAPSQRTEAAQLLVQLDPQHRATARRALIDLLADPATSLQAWECLTEMTGRIQLVSSLHVQL
ncbi:serine protease [Kibdelosporangium aridum]|uniref:Trypsin-like peptidase domain-containing protein n=1 Tax=Kibdelosporangium aridum TaxID=2030 RepID=A0A1Y5YB65_KIBAR|nr:serine protease [Kibdelosporangium aridum]SMD27100.1 Trypsin-like peptidase domain-containing protein [Kibdelosporangium aridum]